MTKVLIVEANEMNRDIANRRGAGAVVEQLGTSVIATSVGNITLKVVAAPVPTFGVEGLAS